MALRKDPMSAAAEAISTIENTCLGSTDDLGGVDVEGEALVCTVGRIHVHPNQVSGKAGSWTLVATHCKRNSSVTRVPSTIRLPSTPYHAVIVAVNATVVSDHLPPQHGGYLESTMTSRGAAGLGGAHWRVEP